MCIWFGGYLLDVCITIIATTAGNQHQNQSHNTERFFLAPSSTITTLPSLPPTTHTHTHTHCVPPAVFSSFKILSYFKVGCSQSNNARRGERLVPFLLTSTTTTTITTTQNQFYRLKFINVTYYI